MKNRLHYFSILLVSILTISCSNKTYVENTDIAKPQPNWILDSEISATEFKNPSNEYRPWVYWYWMNGNVTKEGCLEDIRAMAKVGIAGVFLMDIGLQEPGPAKYRSPEWWDILKAVAKECDKHNIKIVFHDPGWAVAGAP